MPGVRRTRPWTRKPLVAVGIDWSNPLTLGLAGAWALNEGSGSAVKNLAGTTNNGVFNSDGAKGLPTWGSSSYPGAEIGVVCTSTKSNYITCGAIKGFATGATNATIFALGNQVASKDWPVGYNDFTHFRFSSVAFSDNNTYFLVGDGGSDNYGHVASVAGDNSLCMVYNGNATGNANRLAGYRNGGLLSLTFVGTIPASVSLSTFIFSIGQDSTNSSTADGRYDLVLFWSGRSLLPSEVFNLTANPWQVFQPARGQWIMPSVAAAPVTAYGAALLPAM